MQVDLQKYTEFVSKITSKESNDLGALISHLLEFARIHKDVNLSLALTAAMGMAGESGEFSELVKKMVFQKKEYTPELKAHLAKELGDIAWYWVNACRSLDLDPNQIIADNVTKLEARYPGGKFDVGYSENRKEGDV